MTKISYNNEAKFNLYKSFLSAILNRTRFDIVFSLKNGDKCVKQLTQDLKYEQSRISHNLKLLESHGFAIGRRQGKNLIYSLEKNVLNILKEFDGFMKNYERTLKNMKGGRKK